MQGFVSKTGCLFRSAPLVSELWGLGASRMTFDTLASFMVKWGSRSSCFMGLLEYKMST